MRSFIPGLLVALALFTSGAARAESNLVVVELYTSAGCSSCPPADALLAELDKQANVLPLALHVDYWDYIGWKDQFGSPAHTKRQRSYARAVGHRTIYTPQMIIGGIDHVVGNKPMDVANFVNAHRNSNTGVTLDVSRNGGKIVISAKTTGRKATPMVVQLVRYIPSATVKITRGENAGRTIEYTNIVSDWRPIANWNGNRPLQMTANANGDQPVAVIIQAAGPGRVLAAARLR